MAAVLGQEAGQPQELIDAERLAAAGEWDQTVETLTRLIQRLESGPRDAGSARLLITAYERRALARLQTGQRADAAIDLTALLQIDPNHVFVAPTPAIRTFFEDTRKKNLGSLELTVVPADAAVVLEKDGSARADTPPSAPFGPQWLTAGSYRLSIRKRGYETRVEEIDVQPGSFHPLSVELQRTSAVLLLRTSPSGVSVSVNGELRGTTEAAQDGGGLSQPFVIEGLVPRAGKYEVRMEKECFVPGRIDLEVPPLERWKGAAAPDASGWDPDLVFDNVTLRPAFGTLEVGADQPGAVVSIDGVRRGAAGEPITDVCHGEHAIDVRAPTGQFSQRVTVKLDEKITVQATLVPTYGVVSTASRPGVAGAQADRAAVIQALRAGNSRLVPVDLADADVASLASGTGEDLRRATDRLVQQLGTQGVATVTRVAADAQGQDVELRLFARSSSRPDVVRFSLQNAASVQRAVGRLNPQVPLVKPSIGVEAADVMRIDGAVVTSVDPKGPSAGAIVPGDVIVSVGVNSVANVTDLMSALGKTPEPRVNVRLRDKTAPVAVTIEQRPDLVSVREDRLFNLMITDLTARLARQQARSGAVPPGEQALSQGMRLNLGVALFAVGNYSAAQEAFAEVQLDNRPGISKGTVDYWRAVSYKQLGLVADARRLFEAASQAQDARLTENGPAISHLARAELLTLATAPAK